MSTPAIGRLHAGLACLLLLTACGSTRPSRFFTLTPMADAGSHGTTAIDARPVYLDLQGIPATVDRPQFVSSLSENERRVDEYARWAEPLAPHIAGVLVANLSALLAPAPVLGLKQGFAPNPGVVLQVEILRFDALPGGEAVLTARWTAEPTSAGRQPHAEVTETWSEPAAAGAPDQFAAAMSRNLLALSRALAEAASHVPAAKPAD